jgi:serine phosphatase RsbU (regulator of sigma subunit)
MLMADVGGINNLFADVAGRMRDLMKHSINAIAQTSVVSQISAEMYRTSQHGGFASTLLSTFFAPTRTLTICNAGHPPPLLYRSASDDWSSLRYDLAEPLPAADFSGTVMPSEYQSFKLKLDVGDMFFFYSNSLTECRQRDGRTLGVEGILNLAHQFTKAANSENSLSNLILEIRDSHPDNGCGEDATMILGKVTDSRVTLRDNFLAPFRLLRGAADRTSF